MRMEHLPKTNFANHRGDFQSLIAASGWRLNVPIAPQVSPANAAPHWHTESTTILAMKFKDGVVVAGDRRATAGNMIVYDRADKVLNVDEHSILAISGVPSVAWEIGRVLEHSFKYYRRSQLQEMSLAGKVRSLSKLLKENIPMAMQGIGIVIPIFAAYDLDDSKSGGKVFFYDGLGAQFEAVDYATTGSGSPAVRAVLHYQNTWGAKPLVKMTETESVTLALRLLDTAAEFDTATGGYNRRANIFPLVRVITRDGIHEVNDEELAKVYKTES
jgi:proteasome beta subunit